MSVFVKTPRSMLILSIYIDTRMYVPYEKPALLGRTGREAERPVAVNGETA